MLAPTTTPADAFCTLASASTTVTDAKIISFFILRLSKTNPLYNSTTPVFEFYSKHVID
jgi:hypothetical protein